jgi:hypothetical protein
MYLVIFFIFLTSAIGFFMSSKLKLIYTVALLVLLNACASIETTTTINNQKEFPRSFTEQSTATENDSEQATAVQELSTIPAPSSFNTHLYNGVASSELASLTAHYENWEFQNFPGKKHTQYQLAKVQQTSLVKATANQSASMLRKRLKLMPEKYKSVKMAWKVLEKAKNAKVTQGNLDDSSMRLVLAFDGDRTKWSAKDAVLSELSELMTGEPMPYATLMYVLCDDCQEGAVIMNQKTSRIRYLVVGKASGFEGKWQFLKRNIHEDYLKTFQEAPGELVSMGIMTDADNSKTKTSAWYGPVVLE